MKELQRINKLMLLFIDVGNPLWVIIFGQRPLPAQVCEATKFAATTFYKWAAGEPLPHKSAMAVLDNTAKFVEERRSTLNRKRTALACIQSFKAKISAGGKVFYEAADILGYTLDDAQKLIDRHIFKLTPLLPHAYMPEGRAREAISRFGGVHYLYMRRGEDILQCTLRVRYVLDVGPGPIVRCKLNIPKIDRWNHQKIAERWEYDGFVAERDWAMFWSFDKRGDDRADFLHAISDHGNKRDGSYGLIVNYLTTGQDSAQSVLQGVGIIERANEVHQDPVAVEAFMHGQCRVLQSSTATDLRMRLNREYGINL